MYVTPNIDMDSLVEHIFVVFPPGAGGNHLRNLIDKNLSHKELLRVYQQTSLSAHSKTGANFDSGKFLSEKISLGHFGEIMSHRTLIRKHVNHIKLIIISPETERDRQLLNQRRKKLGTEHHQVGAYFDGEQVFLYESFMYHYFFGIAMNNIMNVSISEWFQSDIENLLDRISYFLQIDLDKKLCSEIHALWCQKNLK